VSYMVETDPTDPTGFLATATCTGCSLGCSPVCSMTIDATGLLDTANWPLP